MFSITQILYGTSSALSKFEAKFHGARARSIDPVKLVITAKVEQSLTGLDWLRSKRTNAVLTDDEIVIDEMRFSLAEVRAHAKCKIRRSVFGYYQTISFVHPNKNKMVHLGMSRNKIWYDKEGLDCQVDESHRITISSIVVLALLIGLIINLGMKLIGFLF